MNWYFVPDYILPMASNAASGVQNIIMPLILIVENYDLVFLASLYAANGVERR